MIVAVLETANAKSEDADAPTDTVGRRTLNLLNDRIDQAFHAKVGSMTIADVLNQLDSKPVAKPASVPSVNGQPGVGPPDVEPHRQFGPLSASRLFGLVPTRHAETACLLFAPPRG